jgi:hypothetical protein
MRTGPSLAVLLFACALAAPAHALAEGVALGPQPGEAFTFTFTVGPIEGGRARMSIGRPVRQHGRQGRALIAVHGQALGSPWLKAIMPIEYDYKMVFDAATFFPVEVVSLERGVHERRVSTKLEGRRAELDVKAQKNGGHGVRLLPEVARDPLSALFALRAAPLSDGQVVKELVLDGLALWRVRLTVHRGQTVRLGSGDGAVSRAAIRVDGELTPVNLAGRPTGRPLRHLSLWLADDQTRVLLRLEADTDFGRCALEQTSYLPPSK